MQANFLCWQLLCSWSHLYVNRPRPMLRSVIPSYQFFINCNYSQFTRFWVLTMASYSIVAATFFMFLHDAFEGAGVSCSWSLCGSLYLYTLDFFLWNGAMFGCLAYGSLPPGAFIYVHHNNSPRSNLWVDVSVGTDQHFSDWLSLCHYGPIHVSQCLSLSSFNNLSS